MSRYAQFSDPRSHVCMYVMYVCMYVAFHFLYNLCHDYSSLYVIPVLLAIALLQLLSLNCLLFNIPLSLSIDSF